MRNTPETVSFRARVLQDAGTAAFLVLLLLPFYLLLNQYWKSLVLLAAVYVALGLLFLRLGRHVRRVMRRTPADIPPWRSVSRREAGVPISHRPFGAAEAMAHVYKDPFYLQDVMKPRLRQLLVYRTCGATVDSLATLDEARRSRIEPAVLAFLQRRDATHLWAKYSQRRQRVHDVLATLRYLETL
jgi:hypothetical protein